LLLLRPVVSSRDTRGSTGVAGIRRRMGQEVRGGHMPEAEEGVVRKGSVGVAVKLQGTDLGGWHTQVVERVRLLSG
jgi:hypothetical protein